MTHATLQFNVYKDGYKLLGTASADLPTLSAMTAALSGAGIAGTVDLPLKGMFQAMSMTLNFNTVTTDAASILTPMSHHIELWSAVQDPNPENGALTACQHKVITRATPKNLTLGKIAPAEAQGRATEYELTYVKETYKGKDIIEIDKLNNVYRVGGEDVNSDILEAIGVL